MYRKSLLHRGQRGRLRRWGLLVIAVAAIAGIAAVLSIRTPGVATTTSVPPPPNTAAAKTPAPSQAPTERPTAASPPLRATAVPAGEPSTLDFRRLAGAAARAVYTWDTRAATYSQTYGRLRGWWHVLPDGSNPLTVFAQQFEATGTNAAAYASLTGAKGYRTASLVNSSCDGQLAQFVQHPPPWAGMHVCTVTLAVTEHATSGTNSYTAPVSVILNCPPAVTAPADRCDMVAFYAAPDRIVY
jgi:hypothetical protein